MNPLDKIFLDGLKDHEIIPSERANKLFEESLKAKSNKKPLVYFSMAASILLLLFTGFWVLKNNNQLDNTKTAITSELKNTVNQKSEDGSIEINPNLESNRADMIPPNVLISNAVSYKEYSKEVPSKPIENLVFTVDSKSEILDKHLDNNIKSELISEAKPEKKPAIESIETLVFISPLINAPKVVSNIENLKIVQSTLSDQDYFDEDKSLVTRFLSEVANLKRGEKVDLAKIGFKSLDEISKDDESFIASETKQIKKGYNWIKSKISNN
jgi:hypothetical protein